MNEKIIIDKKERAVFTILTKEEVEANRSTAYEYLL
jgi:hypothetical protein